MAAAQFPTYPGLKGRVVLITGAGHGIGAAVARAFAAQKARVAINYHRSARAAAALAAGLARKGCKAAAYGADASNPLDISATIMRVRKDLGPVSILVNNASLMLLRRPFDRRTWPDFQAELDVALKGAILCAQAVLPDMRKARAGAIVNIITTLTERRVVGVYSRPGGGTRAAGRCGERRVPRLRSFRPDGEDAA